jgi:hypothetical protein
VVKSLPQYHLQVINGMFYIDAVQLANDLETSYTTLVKPHLTTASGGVDPAEMQKRVDEIETLYEQMGTDVLSKLSPPVAPQAAPIAQVPPPGASGPYGYVTTSFSPPVQGVTGPSGPPKSDVSSSTP